MSNFRVEGDRLSGATKIEWLPFRDQFIDPKFIVVHYTGGGRLNSSIKYLRKKGFGYHVLIDRDGSVTQAVPLNKRASHAGYSNWKGYDFLNDHSIGISLANLGYLDQHGSKYYRANSHGDPTTPVFDASEVKTARHWNGHTGSKRKGWELYTESQYSALNAVCAALSSGFSSINEIVSHEAIAVGRKPDPGMAFDWSRLSPISSSLDSNFGPLFRVSVATGDKLNVRKGPNGSWGVETKLNDGEKVHVRSYAYIYKNGRYSKTAWASVARENSFEHVGFVHSGYLKQVN